VNSFEKESTVPDEAKWLQDAGLFVMDYEKIPRRRFLIVNAGINK